MVLYRVRFDGSKKSVLRAICECYIGAPRGGGGLSTPRRRALQRPENYYGVGTVYDYCLDKRTRNNQAVYCKTYTSIYVLW